MAKPPLTVGLSFCSAALHDEPPFLVFFFFLGGGHGGVLRGRGSPACLLQHLARAGADSVHPTSLYCVQKKKKDGRVKDERRTG